MAGFSLVMGSRDRSEDLNGRSTAELHLAPILVEKKGRKCFI